ncbi:hypothetical protein JTB14_006867 [Gonioctena quinquepunctata]|nr:hypothetical protein JTB14_006867 [Gonioctena quinquepunctata]
MDNRNNMLQLCRLCLVKDDVNIPIFEEHGDIRQIFLKISSCLPVKVSREDKLPKKICDGCSYKLDTLYEFWNTSVNAEKQLLTWLGEAGMNSQMADGTISAVAQQIKPTDTFVKQETIEPDLHADEDDDKDYMFQQKFEESGSAGPSATVTSNEEEEPPPPKRARRTAAVKAAIAMDHDSDDDDDSGEPLTKVEDESEDSEGEDQDPSFADAPSTSADDQPGPSGVGKDGVEAPFEMGKVFKHLRKRWSQDQLEQAIAAARRGESQRNIYTRFEIPRRTLRRYLVQGLSEKKLGRPSILNHHQERDFVQRIQQYCQIGLPLTPKLVRHQMFRFCDINKIPNNFNKEKQLAGRDWLSSFLKRNADLSLGKTQPMNPTRAQKLNKAIVSDYFTKISELMATMNIKDKPQNVYNMVEKGCRLTIHHQQRVMSEKGVRRVHMVAPPEHAENVTVVACCNAMGNSIPPMILFRGKRLKPEFCDNLPHGSLVKMAPKGTMTTQLFNEFLRHFAQNKSNGPTLLVFDGASSQLDFTIVETAVSLGITLFCLPANTTHELQPLDKAVFRSFEANWDQELLRYWDTYPQRSLNKARFNIIFSRVWSKCMTPENIMSGFRGTGLFPINPDAIPDAAFAPLQVTKDPTPTYGKNNAVKSIRPKALNYKAQQVTKDVFTERRGQSAGSSAPKLSVPSISKQHRTIPQSTSKQTIQESWLCAACEKKDQLDMRMCAKCLTWYHEACVGLESDDDEEFEYCSTSCFHS